jgi:hypothetical protein
MLRFLTDLAARPSACAAVLAFADAATLSEGA